MGKILAKLFGGVGSDIAGKYVSPFSETGHRSDLSVFRVAPVHELERRHSYGQRRVPGLFPGKIV